MGNCSTDIQFGNLESSIFRIDLDKTSKDHIPTIFKLDGRDKKLLLEYIVSAESQESQVRKITSWILKELDIDDSKNPKELRKFINRIVENLSDEELNEFANHEFSYVSKIKQKIQEHTDSYSAKIFEEWLDTDKVFVKPYL